MHQIASVGFPSEILPVGQRTSSQNNQKRVSEKQLSVQIKKLSVVFQGKNRKKHSQKMLKIRSLKNWIQSIDDNTFAQSSFSMSKFFKNSSQIENMTLQEFSQNLEIDYNNFGFTYSIFQPYFKVNNDLCLIQDFLNQIKNWKVCADKIEAQHIQIKALIMILEVLYDQQHYQKHYDLLKFVDQYIIKPSLLLQNIFQCFFKKLTQKTFKYDEFNIKTQLYFDYFNNLKQDTMIYNIMYASFDCKEIQSNFNLLILKYLQYSIENKNEINNSSFSIACASVGLYSTGFKFFQCIKTPQNFEYQQFLKALLLKRSASKELILNLIDMYDTQEQQDVQVYYYLMQLCYQNKYLDVIENIFKKCLLKLNLQDELKIILDYILKINIAMNDQKKIISLLETHKNLFDSEYYNYIIQLIIKKKSLEGALNITQFLINQNTILESKTIIQLTQLIRSSQQNIMVVAQFLKLVSLYLQKEKLEEEALDAIMYIAFKYNFKQNFIEISNNYQEEQKGDTYYSNYIRFYMKNFQYDNAFDQLQYLKFEKPNKYPSINTLLDHYSKKQNLEKTFKVYEYQRRFGYQKSSIEYTNVLKVCISNNQFKRGIEFFNTIKDEKDLIGMIITFNCALNCYTNQGKMQEAEKLYNEIEEYFGADLITYSTMIKGFSDQKLLEKGFEYIQKLVKTTNEKYDTTISYYLESCNNKEHFKFGIKCFEFLIFQNYQPSIIIIGIMTKIYGISRNLKKAFQMINLAKKLDLKLNLIFFTNLIHVCFYNRDCSKAEKAYQMCRQENINGDSLLYSKLIEGFIRFRKFEKVEKYLDFAIEEGCSLKKTALDELKKHFNNEKMNAKIEIVKQNEIRLVEKYNKNSTQYNKQNCEKFKKQKKEQRKKYQKNYRSNNSEQYQNHEKRQEKCEDFKQFDQTTKTAIFNFRRLKVNNQQLFQILLMKNEQQNQDLNCLNEFIQKLWRTTNEQLIKIKTQDDFNFFCDKISQNFYMQNLCLNQVCNFMISQNQKPVTKILKKLFFLQHIYVKKISQEFFEIGQNFSKFAPLESEKENEQNQNKIEKYKNLQCRNNNKVSFLFQKHQENEQTEQNDNFSKDDEEKQQNMLSDEYVQKKAQELYLQWEKKGLYPIDEFNPLVLTIVCKKVIEKVLKRQNNNREILDSLLLDIKPLQFDESNFQELELKLNNIYKHLRIEIPKKLQALQNMQTMNQIPKNKSIESIIIELLQNAQNQTIDKLQECILQSVNKKQTLQRNIGIQTEEGNCDLNDKYQLLQNKIQIIQQQMIEVKEINQQKSIDLDQVEKKLQKEQQELENQTELNKKQEDMLQKLKDKNKELIKKTREFSKFIEFQKKYDLKFKKFANGIDDIQSKLSFVFGDKDINDIGQNINEQTPLQNIMSLKNFEKKFEQLTNFSTKIHKSFLCLEQNNNKETQKLKNDQKQTLLQTKIKAKKSFGSLKQNQYTTTSTQIFQNLKIYKEKNKKHINQSNDNQNQLNKDQETYDQNFGNHQKQNKGKGLKDCNFEQFQKHQNKEKLSINQDLQTSLKSLTNLPIPKKGQIIKGKSNQSFQQLNNNNLMQFQEYSQLQKLDSIELRKEIQNKYQRIDFNRLNPLYKNHRILNKTQDRVQNKLQSFYQSKKNYIADQRSKSQTSNILLNQQQTSKNKTQNTKLPKFHKFSEKIKTISQTNININNNSKLKLHKKKEFSQFAQENKQNQEKNTQKQHQKIQDSISYIVKQLQYEKSVLKQNSQNLQNNQKIKQIQQQIDNLLQLSKTYENSNTEHQKNVDDMQPSQKQTNNIILQGQQQDFTQFQQIQSFRDENLIIKSKELQDTYEYLQDKKSNQVLDKELKKLKEIIFILKLEQQQIMKPEIEDEDLINEERKKLTQEIFQVFKKKNLKIKKFPILTNQIFIIIEQFYKEHQKCFQKNIELKFFNELKNFVKLKLKKTLINLPKIKFDKNFNFPNFKGKFYKLQLIQFNHLFQFRLNLLNIN